MQTLGARKDGYQWFRSISEAAGGKKATSADAPEGLKIRTHGT